MNKGSYLLGIDIGGTGSKAGVFTLDGKLKGTGYGEYQMISTVPGQAEHNAEAWWQATVKAVQDAIRYVDVYDLITLQAAQAPPGSKGLLFLPYISGERTPIWNPYARGVFFGVTLHRSEPPF